jgi:carboxymethylenebutenolidase
MSHRPAADPRTVWFVLAVIVAATVAVWYIGKAQTPRPASPTVIAPVAGKGEATNSDMLKEKGGADVESAPVSYMPGVTGYLATPKSGGPYPGVVMVHEWWGLNDQIKDTARQLAGRGYDVLAVDLFGSVATTPDQAMAQVKALDQRKATANLLAAAQYLRAMGAPRLGAIGWCFGGGQALQLSLAEPAAGGKLDATVIYYGQLVTDEKALKAITWPVLGVFGDKDVNIHVEDVKKFDAALGDLGVRHEVHIYPGVGHAFANPSGPSYAPEATKDAWAKTTAFLDANLKR